LKGIKRKQLYIDTDLEKLISEKKMLYQKSMATKSKKDKNGYNILKRKVMVKVRKAKNREWENKCSELENTLGYS
jgi:hypothetical protein